MLYLDTLGEEHLVNEGQMKNLFVYGALMFDEVWYRILSGDFQKIPAQVMGYRRLAIRGEHYPGMIKGDGVVQGIIWRGLNEESLATLDEFEGEYYERIPTVAMIESGNTIDVEFFHFKDQFCHLLEGTDWDEERFRATGLQEFIAQYAGFGMS